MSALAALEIPITRSQPWRHQLEGYRHALPLPGAMLAMDMGCGKSRTAIDLIQNRGHRRTLILCPKSVVSNWGDEFEKHGAIPFHVVTLTSGTVAQRAAEAKRAIEVADARNLPAVVVTNHEAAWREPFGAWTMKAGFDCVVVDEIHRAKSPSGKLSLFLSRLGPKVPWRLGLTGTPMPHSPLDVYAQYRFLAPEIYGYSSTRFRARYAVMGGYEGRQVVGYQNESELHRKFFSIAYRVGAEVLDLPETLHIRRSFDLPPAARRIYRELEDEMISDVGSGVLTVANALSRLLRLQQVTSGIVADNDGFRNVLHEEKKAQLADFLEDIDLREPVVVFARFRSDLDQIQAAAESSGRKYGELSGRRNDLAQWKAGGSDVLGVQIQAGGVGVDLTRARYCVYFSLGFSLSDYLQSLKRTHRPGQRQPVTYVHLVARASVDVRVYQALEKRQSVVEAVLGAITGPTDAECAS